MQLPFLMLLQYFDLCNKVVLSDTDIVFFSKTGWDFPLAELPSYGFITKIEDQRNLTRLSKIISNC